MMTHDVEQHLDWLRGDLALGFDAIHGHTISGTQERFIDRFGERILPALTAAPI